MGDPEAVQGARIARVLANAPRNPSALHGFGVARLFEGEIERAAERFRQVLAIQPGHLRAQLDLAHCLLQLDRSDDAVAGLRAMVRSAPQHYGNALKALVSAGRGRFWIRRSAAAKFLNPAAPPFPRSHMRPYRPHTFRRPSRSPV